MSSNLSRFGGDGYVPFVEELQPTFDAINRKVDSCDGAMMHWIVFTFLTYIAAFGAYIFEGSDSTAGQIATLVALASTAGVIPIVMRIGITGRAFKKAHTQVDARCISYNDIRIRALRYALSRSPEYRTAMAEKLWSELVSQLDTTRSHRVLYMLTETDDLSQNWQTSNDPEIVARLLTTPPEKRSPFVKVIPEYEYTMHTTVRSVDYVVQQQRAVKYVLKLADDYRRLMYEIEHEEFNEEFNLPIAFKSWEVHFPPAAQQVMDEFITHERLSEAPADLDGNITAETRQRILQYMVDLALPYAAQINHLVVCAKQQKTGEILSKHTQYECALADEFTAELTAIESDIIMEKYRN